MGKDPDHGSRRLPMANEVPTQDWECLTAELKRLIRNSLSHNTYKFKQTSLDKIKGFLVNYHVMRQTLPFHTDTLLYYTSYLCIQQKNNITVVYKIMHI